MGVNPRVSIVIPVYNGSNYLRDAVDSALAQTYPNIEVLVVDDGSCDDGRTAAVARSYGSRIRYLHKENGGVGSALNLGIREMSGEYFSWLSHDDVYVPHKVERQIAFLAPRGEDVIAYSDYELVDPALKTIKRKTLRDIPAAEFRYRLILESSMHGCTLLIPRAAFAAALFDEQLLTTQDYDMWFRLAQRYRFVRVPESLLKYRIHSLQESWMNAGRFEEGERLLIGFLRELSADDIRAFTAEPLSTLYARVAGRIKFRGFTRAARFALVLSRRHCRTFGDRVSPRRLALLAVYSLAGPKRTPMHWWRQIHFRWDRVRRAPMQAGPRPIEVTADARWPSRRGF